MAIEILMPALSPTMTEGNLAKWLKKEGDKVKPGDVIAEIETDKATMEVEAVDSGIMGKIVIPAKTEGVKVNQLIAVLLEANEAKSAVDEIVKKHQGNATKATPAKQEVVQKVEQPKVVNSPAPTSSSRIFASPLAKRIAEQKGIDLTSVKGTGPHGRIVKDDVLAQRPSTFANTNFQVGRSSELYRVVPHSNMRKVIAKRLVESKQTVPHFYLTVDCQLDELLKLREQINVKAPKQGDKPAYKISVNDFIIKACAQGLRTVPKANASWSDEGTILYNNVDISVAVAIDDGLITPIIKNTDQKSLAQISEEMKDLAARAKTNSLKPEEFQGGGFSISNLGMYGIKQFNAIINPPQACILAVGAAEQKPVVKNGKLEIATVMSLTISCDHRVIDGSVGAELIQAIKNFIEQPAMMLV